jgi:hypothetical protein
VERHDDRAGSETRPAPGSRPAGGSREREPTAPDHRAATGAAPGPSPEVERVVRAVDRAARLGVFRPSCLVRSLALARLLTRRGVAGSRIRIGVRRGAAELDAHAWVELGGRVVGDDPRHTARFTPITTVAPVERR